MPQNHLLKLRQKNITKLCEIARLTKNVFEYVEINLKVKMVTNTLDKIDNTEIND